MLPNALIVGATRSGSTYLFNLLSQHHQIYVPETKELRFFEKDDEYFKGLTYYENYFVGSQAYPIRLEASPNYFHKGIVLGKGSKHRYDDNDPAKRIFNSLGADTKIIITLRNPIDRLFSMHQKNYLQKREPFQLEEALKAETEGNRNELNSELCWIYKNTYSKHLNHWFSLFPSKNIKVIIFEEWIHNLQLIHEIFSFLNLDSDISLNSKVEKNKVDNYDNYFTGTIKKLLNYPKANKLTASKRDMIAGYLAFDNEISKVEELLDRTIAPWHQSTC